MRHAASRALWLSVAEQSNVRQYLVGIKDVFLLGHGELLQAFIDATRGEMSLTPNDAAEERINRVWRDVVAQTAARSASVDDEHLIVQSVTLSLAGWLDAPPGASAGLSSLFFFVFA